MSKRLGCLFLVLLFAGTTQAQTNSAAPWIEGQHYFAIKPAQPTNVAPGKVEVIEVFSYGCPACYQFYPTADKLKAALPKNAEMSYLPASFIPTEDWPMFQRAYLTAQAMGVADKAHNAMFKAVWVGDEMATFDHNTNQPKKPMPSIENAAAFYARVTGVNKDAFLKMAQSFSIEVRMRSADAAIKAYRAESTPTMVINGKYRLTVQSAGGADQLIDLVKWLVAKETK